MFPPMNLKIFINYVLVRVIRKQTMSVRLLLLFILIASSPGCQKSENGAPVPVADHGRLDLRGFDFSTEGSVALQGEWLWYPNQFIVSDNANRSEKETGIVSLPSRWNQSSDGKGGVMGSFGYGSYQLTILTDPDVTDLDIQYTAQYTSFRLYVNGKLIAVNGNPGKDEENTEAEYRPGVNAIPVGDGRLELVFEVANYKHYRGGIWEVPSLGKRTILESHRWNRIASTFFMFGGLTFIALYFFIYGLVYKNDYTLHYFAILAFLSAVSLLYVGSTRYLYMIFQDRIGWEISKRIHFFLLFNLLPAGMAYFRSLFPRESNNYVYYFINTASFVLVSLTLFFPVHVFTASMVVFDIIFIFSFLYVILVMERARRRRRDGAAILLSGWGIFFIIILNDLLHDLNIIHSAHVAGVGFIILIISNLLVLAGRQKKLHEFFNRELQKRVEERTEELKNAKDRAEMANRSRGIFLANMSHELRTPLNGILGFAQLMETDGEVHERHRESISMIRQSGELLLNLINEILDYTSMDMIGESMNNEEVNLRRLLDEVMMTTKLHPDSRRLTLKLEDDGIPERIYTSDKRLRQILLNLMSNAVKFTKDGKVLLKIIADDTAEKKDPIKITFVVVDTGRGIPSKKLTAILEPFEQAATFYEQTEGVGLGLSITRTLVSKMGGDLQLGSRCNGEEWISTNGDGPPEEIDDTGTAVWFTLDFPLHNGDAQLPDVMKPFENERGNYANPGNEWRRRQKDVSAGNSAPDNSTLDELIRNIDAGNIARVHDICEGLKQEHGDFVENVEEYLTLFRLNKLRRYVENIKNKE